MLFYIFASLFLSEFVLSEGYYCPYPELGAVGDKNLLYDYYTQQGTTYVRLGQIGWETRSEYCSAKGDLSIHPDAGQAKCEDSQGTCFWTGSSCIADDTKAPDCLALCQAISGGGGLACLGADCPGGPSDRSQIYAICDNQPITPNPTTDPNAPVDPSIPTPDPNAPVDPNSPVNSSCTWLDHCLGATCTNENDCDGELVCSSGICASDNSNVPAVDPNVNSSCTWLDHCLGATCTNENDCDGDLVCSSGVCATIDTSLNSPHCTLLKKRKRFV
jgi:hypothetical protein